MLAWAPWGRGIATLAWAPLGGSMRSLSGLKTSLVTVTDLGLSTVLQGELEGSIRSCCFDGDYCSAHGGHARTARDQLEAQLVVAEASLELPSSVVETVEE